MAKFTIFCRDASNTGTTYITAVDAPDIEAAKRLGLEECAEEWGQEVDEIRVLGVAEGDVTILEWDDEFEY